MQPNQSHCFWCKLGSKIFGHWLTKLLGLKWEKISYEQVEPYLKDLNLRIVGGLSYRGYTEHDIDIVGAEKDVITFAKRLHEIGVTNLVHYCGPQTDKHSHWIALKNGFRVTFRGNKMYL